MVWYLPEGRKPATGLGDQCAPLWGAVDRAVRSSYPQGASRTGSPKIVQIHWSIYVVAVAALARWPSRRSPVAVAALAPVAVAALIWPCTSAPPP